MDRRLRTLAVCVLVTCMTATLGISAIAQEHSGQEHPAQEHPGRPGTERRPVQVHPGGGAAGHQEQGGPGVLSLLPSDSVTQHSIDIAGGGKLDYTATAGTFSLFDQSGERSAAIFYTAYVAKPAGQPNRPVTFVFNGGPEIGRAHV